MAAMGVSISLVYLDQTVLPVALPTIQRELGLTEIALQWTINTYLLALAVFVLAGGRLGDMFGHRRIFSFGLFIFALASAVCGLSHTTGLFLVGRALQGLGGAFIIPTVPVMLAAAFPSEHLGKVFGLYISIGAFFLSLGPLVGGMLTEYLSWRYVFWINPPIAALGLLITFLAVGPSRKKEESFDFFGFFSLVLGIGGIITALMQGKIWGWASWPVLALGFGGFALLAMLLTFDRKVADPFIDFSLFRKRSFVVGNLCIFCTQFILILTVFWVIYFQKILHYSPTLAGIWSMLASSPVIAVGAISGHLFDRYGGKLPITLGFCFVAFALSWFIFVPKPASPVALLPIILPFGCGIPMILIPSFTLFLSEISEHKRGTAVGTSTTLRQLGSTAGMAIFGAIFLHQQGSSFQRLLAKHPDTSPLNPSSFDGLLSKAPKAMDALQALPPQVAEKVQSDFAASTVFASTSMNIVGLCLTLLALLLVTKLLPWGHFKTKGLGSS